MSEKLKRIFGKKDKAMSRYEEDKETFEEVMGKPHIDIRIDLPKGFESETERFQKLVDKEGFKKDVEKLVKKHLQKKE